MWETFMFNRRAIDHMEVDHQDVEGKYCSPSIVHLDRDQAVKKGHEGITCNLKTCILYWGREERTAVMKSSDLTYNT